MGNKTLKEHLKELSKKDVSLFKINQAKRKLNKITDFDELTEGLTGFTKLQLLYIKTNLSDKSIMSSLMTYISYTFTLGAGILIEKKTDDFTDAGAFLLVLAFWGFFMFMAVMLDKSIRNNFKHKLILDYFITLAIEKVDDSSNNNAEKNNAENNNIETYLNELIDSKITMMGNIDNIIRVFNRKLYSAVSNRINELVKLRTGDISKVLESYESDKLIDLKFVIENIKYFRLVDKQIIACLLFLSSSILGALYTGTLEASFSLKGWLIIGCMVIFTITSYSVKILFPKLGVKEEYLLSLIKKAIKDKDK